MAFKKYNHTNNAFCELLTDLQSSDTTMMLTGNYNRLPTSNFIVKISKYQGTKCVARENIYVANRNNNICTGLIRAYEKVPMDDDATEWIQQALNFSAGDIVECVVSSEIIKDIQENFSKLKNIPDKRHTPFPAPQEVAKKSTWYEFRPINSGDAGQLLISWEQAGWAVVETISGWTFDSVEWYVRQIAYRVNPRVNEMYMRFWKTPTEWGEWEKVYPKNSIYDGKFSEVATMHETIVGSPDNPVPVCIGKKFRVDLRLDFQNRIFSTSTNSNSTNRQIVITNGEYQIKLKKFFTETGLSNTIFIEVEWSGQKQQVAVLNSSGVTNLDYTLEPNRTYILTGFPTISGNFQKKYITNKNITISGWVGWINAMEFDMQNKIYKCQANSMYTCLARCDGFITKTEMAWSQVRIWFIDNYFYQNSFSSITQNGPVFIWNGKGVVSSTKWEIPAIIGSKKNGGFLTQRQDTNNIIYRLSGTTDYSYSEFSENQSWKYTGFFAGWDARISLKWGWYWVNATLFFHWVDGIDKSWNINDGSTNSDPTPIQLTEKLEAWYFSAKISMSNSSNVAIEVYW